MTHFLTISNFSKTFDGCFEPALKNINLSVNKGDFCIVIGSNGSGKSTLFRCIMEMTDKNTASVVQDVNQGTVPQMTLLENIVLSITRGKRANLLFYKSKYESLAREYLQAAGVGLEDRLHEPIRQLSGGQRQMVATVMAVQSKPDLLLLDEHTAALDPQMQQQIMHYVADAVKKAEITTMMITHKLDDAIQYGNRLMMLHKGQIVFDVSGDEKASLTTQALLSLFHRYEDQTLLAGATHVP